MPQQSFKPLLDKFLGLPQWQQGAAAAVVLGVLFLLWPSSAPTTQVAPAAPIVPATPAAATPKFVPPTPKIAEKSSDLPVGTTAITKLKLVKALPLGLVTDATLKGQLENQYQAQLSFPLNEDKMVRFAEAALQVESTNRRWDLQIAAAQNDAMAIEYLKMSRNESVKAVQTVTGITMPEYTEIYNLTAQDNQFNQIAIAYKNLVATAQKKQAAAEKLAAEKMAVEELSKDQAPAPAMPNSGPNSAPNSPVVPPATPQP